MSKASWSFDPSDSASRLVDEFRALVGIDKFDLSVVLGSGWSEAAKLGQTLGTINYSDWPCFPAGQIKGHGGQLSAVKLSHWNVLFFSGRFHCYQGLSAYQASFPVRLAAALGCPRLLLTCATGGINETYRPGEFMLVDDHLNLIGDNPLRGLPGDVFVDLTSMYEHQLYAQLSASPPESLTLHRGVLAAMPGPSYETPAEIRFLAGVGADVVSMSTVHEAIMARYLDMRVAAVAFVSNFAAGRHDDVLNHQDVLACSHEHAELFPSLVQYLIDTWQTVTTCNPD